MAPVYPTMAPDQSPFLKAELPLSLYYVGKKKAQNNRNRANTVVRDECWSNWVAFSLHSLIIRILNVRTFFPLLLDMVACSV
jgi:hypothetical protein